MENDKRINTQWVLENPERQKFVRELSFPFSQTCLIESFEKLSHDLKPYLHEYDLLIGDDVSGRLPTLVFADLVKWKREKLGLPPPETLFINAGSNLYEFQKDKTDSIKELSEIIKGKKRLHGLKCLVVTEYISTSNSISILVQELQKSKLKPDVCTLSMRDISSTEEIPTTVFYGEIDDFAGSIFFYRPELSGMISTGSLISSKRDFLNPHDKKEAIEARREMKKIANYLWKIIE